MALETLSNITQDEIEYARMTTIIKSELDYRSEMEYERDKGREEAGLEITRKMKDMCFSSEQIQAVTGLSI